MKYMRRGHRMYIHRMLVCLDQLLISRYGCQHAQLYLRIVRIDEGISLLRYEYIAYAAAQLSSDGDILEIRLRRGYPACRGDSLIERTVYTSVSAYEADEPHRICRVELHELTIAQDLFYYRAFIRQLLQHIGRCRISCLCLFAALEREFFKQHDAQLLGRVDIEPFSRQLVYLLLQYIDLPFQLLAVCRQPIAVHLDTRLLHPRERIYQRHLCLLIELPHTGFLDRRQSICSRLCGKCHTLGTVERVEQISGDADIIYAPARLLRLPEARYHITPAQPAL